MSDDHDSNWLHAAVIACPSCSTKLYRVDRSPFYDSDHLYCERCPKSAEVPWYDPIYTSLAKVVSRSDTERFRDAVEALLLACDCGGSFRYAAPARCLACGAIAVPAGVDLHPYSAWCDAPETEPTEAELAAEDAFRAAFIRDKNLWRSEAAT